MRIVVLTKQVPDTWGERELDLATGRVVRRPSEATVDEVAERALELALVAKDADAATEVVVLTMGPASARAGHPKLVAPGGRRGGPGVDRGRGARTFTARVAKAAAAATVVVGLSLGPAAARDGLRKLLATGADRAVHVVDESLVGADLRLTAQVLAAAVARLDADLVIAGEASTDGRGGMIPSAISSVLGLPFLGALEDTRGGGGGAGGGGRPTRRRSAPPSTPASRSAAW